MTWGSRLAQSLAFTTLTGETLSRKGQLTLTAPAWDGILAGSLDPCNYELADSAGGKGPALTQRRFWAD